MRYVEYEREQVLFIAVRYRTRDSRWRRQHRIGTWPRVAPYMDDLGTARKVGVIEGIEHLLMSLARTGVDLSRPEFAVAIRDCVANLRQ